MIKEDCYTIRNIYMYGFSLYRHDIFYLKTKIFLLTLLLLSFLNSSNNFVTWNGTAQTMKAIKIANNIITTYKMTGIIIKLMIHWSMLVMIYMFYLYLFKLLMLLAISCIRKFSTVHSYMICINIYYYTTLCCWSVPLNRQC